MVWGPHTVRHCPFSSNDPVPLLAFLNGDWHLSCWELNWSFGIRANIRPVRPCNRNLCLLNLDPHQIAKRTLSIKSPVRTVHGVTLAKRADVYTLEKRNIFETPKFFKSGSNVASHAWLEGHTIDFENACVIDRSNSRVRKTLESWHTAITSQADNNAKHVPRQYSILL